MLKWLCDGNKHETVWEAYAGSIKITVVRFSAGNYQAWANCPPSASWLVNRKYPNDYEPEEVKREIVKELEEYLVERNDYYLTLRMSLWEAMNNEDCPVD